VLDVRLVSRIATRVEGAGFAQIAELFAWCVSGAFILLGVLRMRRSRLEAYRMFERAVLTSILLVEVFVFYREQFAALTGLALNLVLLATLRIMIKFEVERVAGPERRAEVADPGSPTGPTPVLPPARI